METALNKRCLKELVVALELSDNGGVLTGIQKWAEENSKEITVHPAVELKLIHVRLPSLQSVF